MPRSPRCAPPRPASAPTRRTWSRRGSPPRRRCNPPRAKCSAQRGALETAQLNLQYGTIRAPISGLIGDTLVPVGGLVTPNAAQPLTTIVPLDPIWVRFKVSEAQYLALRRGRPAKEAPTLRTDPGR